jgi:hypothetical protein
LQPNGEIAVRGVRVVEQKQRSHARLTI